jgi:hypothetical protein
LEEDFKSLFLIRKVYVVAGLKSLSHIYRLSLFARFIPKGTRTNLRACFVYCGIVFGFFTTKNYTSVNALVVGIIGIKLTTFGASGTVSFNPLLMRYLYSSFQIITLVNICSRFTH